jgi:hypothetical protein
MKPASATKESPATASAEIELTSGMAPSLSINKDLQELIDGTLSPFLPVAESAVSEHARIPVLSLWKRVPFVSLFASHLHLRWPGEVRSLPLSPRIGIFPFFASDLELLSRPLYHVREAQTVRQAARTKRFFSGSRVRGELNPSDWEQAIHRRRERLERFVLPASSFISIDRVNEAGDIIQGHRGHTIARFAPRSEPRPQLLVPARGEVTRQLAQTFSDLDLVFVNAQNIRGRHLASSIEFFLRHVSGQVPMLIFASSPADLVSVGALEPPSRSPVLVTGISSAPKIDVKEVNRDRAQAERQFCFAVDGLEEKSDLLSRLVSQAKRTWWATRQSMSITTPWEAGTFENLYADVLSRFPGCELELLEEAKRLIAKESTNSSVRDERRNSLIKAVLHEAKVGKVLVLVRSDHAADEIRSILADYLGFGMDDLSSLGVDVQSVFRPWPTSSYDTCIASGYFGTNTVDLLFAGGAQAAVLIVDPIEARVAVWDIEKRFCDVPTLPERIRSSLRTASSALELVASPSSVPISLSSLTGDGAHHSGSGALGAAYTGKSTFVCLCFTDGSTQQVASNARFEVVGRQRLRLQSLAAKDLHVGDQVVLLNDDERAAFSEKLLQAMDEGRFRQYRQKRTTWMMTLRAALSDHTPSATDIKKRMEGEGVTVDPSTIRTWLRPTSSADCGVPEREKIFLAFAQALDITLPKEILTDWFNGINQLRIDHRRIGRELVRAIRGAYLGRLDPVTVAKMEREWGVEAKTLLEAARVGTIDDVIPLDAETV